MKSRFRTSSELGLLVVACLLGGGCNAITNLGPYSFTDPAERDVTHCGFTENEDCATTLPVPGGIFFRNRTRFKNTAVPSDRAAVSSFRLDKFEVTVGRFREFIDAVTDGGVIIAPATGKHLVHDGNGLRTATSGFETGWSGPPLPATREKWDAALTDAVACGGHATWTKDPGNNERKPINCVSWSEAYAFCIWKNGFLPSEAEWIRAASGSDMREFPWGNEPPRDDATGTLRAAFGCFYGGRGPGTCDAVGVANIAKVGFVNPSFSKGPYGHLDLAGNLSELTLDAAPSTTDTFETGLCKVDCFNPPKDTSRRAVRGGSFDDPASGVSNFARGTIGSTARSAVVGFRCAYPP